MKERYEKPEISIIIFNTEDVIVTSGKPNVVTPITDGEEEDE